MILLQSFSSSSPMQKLDHDEQASQLLYSIFSQGVHKVFSFPKRVGGREMNEIQGKSGDPRSVSTGNTSCFPISPMEAIEENKS